MNKPPKHLTDRVFEFLFGPDEEEAVDDALDAEDEVLATGAVPLRKPDYTVEVTFDPETQVFVAKVKTKTRNLDIDVDGATPGEAFAYVGMLIDTSLVRRGFGREGKIRE